MTMRRVGLIALALLLLPVGSARAQEYDPLHTTLGTLPEFTLTDQHGNTVQREQLLGKVCVISFFFTCCADVCPKTQAAMAHLQERFAGSGDVLLVSINVYPSHDSQELLTQYALDKHADPGQWLFLRGDENEIRQLVKERFQQALEKNPEGKRGYEIIHSPSLLVIDHRGGIRGYA